MKFKNLGIIAILLASVLAMGCVNSSEKSSSSSVLITTSPAQMLPTINDMPDGTQKSSETANETYAERLFLFHRIPMGGSLRFKINKFSSIDEAKENYNFIKNGFSEYKLTSKSLGDEGFGLSQADIKSTIAFRKANVVVTVVMYGYTTLDETESYAKMVRI